MHVSSLPGEDALTQISDQFCIVTEDHVNPWILDQPKGIFIILGKLDPKVWFILTTIIPDM